MPRQIAVKVVAHLMYLPVTTRGTAEMATGMKSGRPFVQSMSDA